MKPGAKYRQTKMTLLKDKLKNSASDEPVNKKESKWVTPRSNKVAKGTDAMGTHINQIEQKEIDDMNPFTSLSTEDAPGNKENQEMTNVRAADEVTSDTESKSDNNFEAMSISQVNLEPKALPKNNQNDKDENLGKIIQ